MNGSREKGHVITNTARVYLSDKECARQAALAVARTRTKKNVKDSSRTIT